MGRSIDDKRLYRPESSRNPYFSVRIIGSNMVFLTNSFS